MYTPKHSLTHSNTHLHTPPRTIRDTHTPAAANASVSVVRIQVSVEPLRIPERLDPREM